MSRRGDGWDAARRTLEAEGSGVRRRDLEVLFGLMGVENEGLERGERTQGTLELRRFALVLQIVAPHLVELAAHCAGVAENLVAHVHLLVG